MDEFGDRLKTYRANHQPGRLYIWLAFYGVDYEGDDFKGAFFKREDAVAKLQEIYKDGYRADRWYVSEVEVQGDDR